MIDKLQSLINGLIPDGGGRCECWQDYLVVCIVWGGITICGGCLIYTLGLLLAQLAGYLAGI